MRIDDITWTLDISIHAPVKGATFIVLALFPVILYFNPRTREGCDLPGNSLYTLRPAISIHAPVKGATQAPYVRAAGRQDFNPRTREGCDRLTAAPDPDCRLFQSTHP